MGGCNRCEYKSTNKSNQQTHNNHLLWIYITDVNIKRQMRIINKHIILFIMDGCNRCEYISTNKSHQQTYDIIHGEMKYECN